jgi:Rod binding domain-containing protein
MLETPLLNLIDGSTTATDAHTQIAEQYREGAKIENSAKDFESLLLGNWLQQAEESFAKLPGSDDEENSGSVTAQFQGIAMQSLGTAITAAGGIGLAKMISGQLHTVAEGTAAAEAAMSLPHS